MWRVIGHVKLLFHLEIENIQKRTLMPRVLREKDFNEYSFGALVNFFFSKINPVKYKSCNK